MHNWPTCPQRGLTAFKRSALLLPMLALAACENDDPDFLRSSAKVGSGSLNAYISADVHTHLGSGGEPDETHTTLEAEFFAYDKDDHYYYNVELGEGDRINATVDGATEPLPALALPSASHKVAVVYTRDYPQIGAGQLFTVNLDRDRDAALHSFELILPEESAFTVTPAAAEVSTDEAITLEWTSTADYHYKLQIEFLCERADTSTTDAPLYFRVKYPNYAVETIESPFTFTPSSLFSPSDPTTLASCELITSLFSIAPTQEPDSGLNSVLTRTTRQQMVKKTLML